MFGQQTVGLFLNTPESYPGYTLFSGGSTTYLVDNCGYLAHQWESEYKPGVSFYLLENGNLIRPVFTEEVTGFSAGGVGGAIEMLDWDSNQLWYFDFAEMENYHQHHDIEPLPNGNVLVLAWSFKNNNEVIEAGRSPIVTSGNLWPTYIAEIQPSLPLSAVIVWEWHLWDHLIQDFDNTKQNFGVVEDHPELMDINFTGTQGVGADWMHCNAIEYIPEHDLIAISSRNTSEIYIIDHSTTTEEAAGHTGGNYGKGGDFLYRWGNPQSYKQGTEEDRKLYGQHDVSWIPPDLPGGGQFMVFNNGTNRPEGSYSTGNSFQPPMNADGSFNYNAGEAFGPAEFSWSYQEPYPFDLFSSTLSSCRRLPNGNTLLCEGRTGKMIEVNENKEHVWEYQNPANSDGPVTQGIPINNLFGSLSTFKAERYSLDYPAFTDKNILPTTPIELNPLSYDCSVTVSATSLPNLNLRVFPNPTSNYLYVDHNLNTAFNLELFSANGKLLKSETHNQKLDLSDLSAGIYFLKVYNDNYQLISKVVKQMY